MYLDTYVRWSLLLSCFFCLRYTICFSYCVYYLLFLFVFPPEVIFPLQSYCSLSCDHGLHCIDELMWEQQKQQKQAKRSTRYETIKHIYKSLVPDTYKYQHTSTSTSLYVQNVVMLSVLGHFSGTVHEVHGKLRKSARLSHDIPPKHRMCWIRTTARISPKVSFQGVARSVWRRQEEGVPVGRNERKVGPQIHPHSHNSNSEVRL